MPSNQFFAHRFDVWKTRPVIIRWQPISRDDRVKLRLRSSLYLWIKDKREEERRHRRDGLKVARQPRNKLWESGEHVLYLSRLMFDVRATGIRRERPDLPWNIDPRISLMVCTDC